MEVHMSTSNSVNSSTVSWFIIAIDSTSIRLSAPSFPTAAALKI